MAQEVPPPTVSDALLSVTRRPASADRTARRQFQSTGQPVSRTQASYAMTSRLPRYEAKCVQRRCFQCGYVPLRSDIKGTELPPALRMRRAVKIKKSHASSQLPASSQLRSSSWTATLSTLRPHCHIWTSQLCNWVNHSRDSP